MPRARAIAEAVVAAKRWRRRVAAPTASPVHVARQPSPAGVGGGTGRPPPAHAAAPPPRQSGLARQLAALRGGVRVSNVARRVRRTAESAGKPAPSQSGGGGGAGGGPAVNARQAADPAAQARVGPTPRPHPRHASPGRAHHALAPTSPPTTPPLSPQAGAEGRGTASPSWRERIAAERWDRERMVTEAQRELKETLGPEADTAPAGDGPEPQGWAPLHNWVRGHEQHPRPRRSRSAGPPPSATTAQQRALARVRRWQEEEARGAPHRGMRGRAAPPPLQRSRSLDARQPSRHRRTATHRASRLHTLATSPTAGVGLDSTASLPASTAAPGSVYSLGTRASAVTTHSEAAALRERALWEQRMRLVHVGRKAASLAAAVARDAFGTSWLDLGVDSSFPRAEQDEEEEEEKEEEEEEEARPRPQLQPRPQAKPQRRPQPRTQPRPQVLQQTGADPMAALATVLSMRSLPVPEPASRRRQPPTRSRAERERSPPSRATAPLRERRARATLHVAAKEPAADGRGRGGSAPRGDSPRRASRDGRAPARSGAHTAGGGSNGRPDGRTRPAPRASPMRGRRPDRSPPPRPRRPPPTAPRQASARRRPGASMERDGGASPPLDAIVAARRWGRSASPPPTRHRPAPTRSPPRRRPPRAAQQRRPPSSFAEVATTADSSARLAQLRDLIHSIDASAQAASEEATAARQQSLAQQEAEARLAAASRMRRASSFAGTSAGGGARAGGSRATTALRGTASKRRVAAGQGSATSPRRGPRIEDGRALRRWVSELRPAAHEEAAARHAPLGGFVADVKRPGWSHATY